MDCHSISPLDGRSTRNIKQANQEYPSKYSESKGQKLEEQALWAHRTAFKRSIGMTPYQIVYVKPYHLPIELEHKAFWVIKKWNMDLMAVGIKRKI
jgi:hypothetical protein